jgi:hypothetical protein
MKTLIKKLKYFFSNPVIFAEYKQGIMTVNYKDGKVDQFQGDCTVWYKLPYMKRCGTLKEGFLCELWKYNKKWGGAYPDAHKK